MTKKREITGLDELRSVNRQAEAYARDARQDYHDGLLASLQEAAKEYTLDPNKKTVAMPSKVAEWLQRFVDTYNPQANEGA